MCKEDHRLEAQKWYHGLTTRDICSPLLKVKGDFLVRATQKGSAVSIILNVRRDHNRSVDNFVITTSGPDKKYILKAILLTQSGPTFDSIPLLINYYKMASLPNGVKLIRGIARPKWLIDTQAVFYDKNDVLGSGNFGAVYKGILMGKTQCAIKVVHNESRGSEFELEQENEARISMIREADLMATYRNENIVKFLGFACLHPPTMLVLEYCPGGSLDKHLRENGKYCTDFEKMIYMLEAARGMRYLHKKKCIHRDLASRNCLIDSKGITKIADFGLSVTLKTGRSLTDTMQCIPLRWMAPECLQEPMEFSYNSDMWAFGVLIFEIFSNGSKPFAHLNGENDDRKIFKRIRRIEMPSSPEGSPSCIQKFLNLIWKKEPEERPTFKNLLIQINEDLAKIPGIQPSEFVVNRLPNITRNISLVGFTCNIEKSKRCFWIPDQMDDSENRSQKKTYLQSNVSNDKTSKNNVSTSSINKTITVTMDNEKEVVPKKESSLEILKQLKLHFIEKRNSETQDQKKN